MKRSWNVYLDQATDGATGADAGGAPGASVDAGNATQQPATVLGTAGQSTPPGERPEHIPEKYWDAEKKSLRDGAVDAVLKENQFLAKKVGAGELPPKDAKEYAFTLPDSLKDLVEIDEKATEAFKAKAHAMGLTQKQYETVMTEYATLLPGLLEANTQLSAEECTTELKSVWKSDEDFSKSTSEAKRAMLHASQVSGIESSKLFQKFGNDPDFIRLMQAFGREMQEDVVPGGEGGAQGDSVETLMQSEAYKNPKHADHERVSRQVKTFFERKYGTGAVA